MTILLQFLDNSRRFHDLFPSLLLPLNFLLDSTQKTEITHKAGPTTVLSNRWFKNVSHKKKQPHDSNEAIFLNSSYFWGEWFAEIQTVSHALTGKTFVKILALFSTSSETIKTGALPWAIFQRKSKFIRKKAVIHTSNFTVYKILNKILNTLVGPNTGTQIVKKFRYSSRFSKILK